MIRYSLLILLLNLYGVTPINTKHASTPVIVKTSDSPFLMPVEDVFSISGRGTVATGRVLRGVVKVGDSIDIAGINERVIRTKVKSIEMFRKMPTEAKEGDNCGLLLASVLVSDVKRGMVLAKPGSMTACSKFTCELVFKTKEDGGRQFAIADNFRTQFLIYNNTFSGKIKLPEGMQNITLAQKTTVTIEMETPVAVEKDLKFSIMEYGKEIGSGIIIQPLKN